MRNSFASITTAALLSTVVLARAPRVAHADADDHPMPARVGLELGGGVQGGKIFCDSQNGFCNGFSQAAGVNLQVSYFIDRTFGFTADFWAMAHTENNFTFTHIINTVGVKWRPVPIITLQAGVGDAHASLSYGNGNNQLGVTSDNAFAIMVGAGLDVLRMRRFALSVEVRAGNGFYGDKNNDGKADVVGRNVGVGVGLTWFNF